jgi:hypothetical protein
MNDTTLLLVDDEPQIRRVLALQDRLAYGPTFDSAMRALFGERSRR